MAFSVPFPFLSLLIASATIEVGMSRLGMKGVPAHDPIAIWALNVCDDMLCWRWLTWRRPHEKARSASTEEAEMKID